MFQKVFKFSQTLESLRACPLSENYSIKGTLKLFLNDFGTLG